MEVIKYPTELSQVPEEELFLMMSYKASNEKEALEAFNEFHARYKDFLWGSCQKTCLFHGKSDASLPWIIFNNTLLSVYYHPGTFMNIEDVTNKKSKQDKVRIWLSKIATNEFLKAMNEEKERSQQEESMFVIIAESTEPDTDADENEFTSAEKKILDAALSQLDDRERDVLLTYMRYLATRITDSNDKETPVKYVLHAVLDGDKLIGVKYAELKLPSDVLNAMCEYWKTTPDNILHVKKRTIEKFMKQIDTLKIKYNYGSDQRFTGRGNV